jgi:hypothetical protein
MILFRILTFTVGFALVIGTLFSAIRTFVLTRSAPDRLTGAVYLVLRKLFMLFPLRERTYHRRDRIMAYYAPVALLSLLPVWLTLVLFGYMTMYWALGVDSWYHAFRISSSSLLTLGYATADNFPHTFLEFTEATIGLMLVALLIAYLPSMYNAFQRREAAVKLLEVRASSPPTAVEMLKRFNRIHGWERLSQQWETWEKWFAEIEESHTSLAALVFFRSPKPDHSWLTATGAVLDSASLTLSAIDIPSDPQAALCIRAGYLALMRIADFFDIPFNSTPSYPTEPISVTRDQFEAALDELQDNDVPLKADRDQAWRDFAGWRVNYDRVLLALADLTMAPPSPWTGERKYI